MQDQKPVEDQEPAEERAAIEQHRLAELREMRAQGEHLEETIEDARDAVRAAHNADSMRSPGAQGDDAEERGPQAFG